MSHKYKATELDELYFITITTIDWVDLFTRRIYKDIIIQSLKYCQMHRGLKIHAYVIMGNHLHAIVSSGNEQLHDIVRDMKKFTSKSFVKTIKEINESRREWLLKKFQFAAKRVKKGVNYKVWKDGYHAVHLSTNIMIDQRLNYIHNNPVKAGYVLNPEDYLYSSAGTYAGGSGMLTLQMLD